MTELTSVVNRNLCVATLFLAGPTVAVAARRTNAACQALSFECVSHDGLLSAGIYINVGGEWIVSVTRRFSYSVHICRPSPRYTVRRRVPVRRTVVVPSGRRFQRPVSTLLRQSPMPGISSAGFCPKDWRRALTRHGCHLARVGSARQRREEHNLIIRRAELGAARSRGASNRHSAGVGMIARCE